MCTSVARLCYISELAESSAAVEWQYLLHTGNDWRRHHLQQRYGVNGAWGTMEQDPA